MIEIAGLISGFREAGETRKPFGVLCLNPLLCTNNVVPKIEFEVQLLCTSMLKLIRIARHAYSVALTQLRLKVNSVSITDSDYYCD